MTTLKKLNEKLKLNYDLVLSRDRHSKKVRCYLNSINTKEDKDLCFARDYINKELQNNVSLRTLSYLPFFN